MNMKKSLIGLLLCICISMWSADTQVQVGDLYYRLNGVYASVTPWVDNNNNY